MRKSFWHQYDDPNDVQNSHSEPSLRWLYSEPIMDPYELLGIPNPNVNFTKVKSPLEQAMDNAVITA